MPLTDANRAKLDGLVSQMQKNGESDGYIQGVVEDFKKKYVGTPGSPSGHAPTWKDDVNASASFLGDELKGVGAAFNPKKIVKGMYDGAEQFRRDHPIASMLPGMAVAVPMAEGLAQLPGQMYDQYQNGDMSGLAQNIGNIAGNVIMGKVAPEIPGAARKAAGVVSDAASATIDTAKTAAAHPIVKAVAPVLVKQAVKTALNSVPMARTAVDLWEMASKVQKAMNTAEDAPNVPLKTSTKVQIPTEFSPESVSDTMGTKPPKVEVTDSAGKGTRTSDGLDKATHDRLAEAAGTGEMKALPVEARSALVKAVKAGDSDAVHTILDAHSAVKRVDAAVENKVSVLVKYALDHGIDLSSVTPEGRQALADAAHAHGVKNGMSVPKGGYRGISDDSYQMVLDRLNGKK